MILEHNLLALECCGNSVKKLKCQVQRTLGRALRASHAIPTLASGRGTFAPAWKRMKQNTDSLDKVSPPAPANGAYKIPALRVLSEITTSLSSDSNIEDLLERFLSTMIRLAGAHAGAVRILTADGQHMRLIGSIGLPPEVIEREQYTALECGVCGKAARDHSVESSHTGKVCHENMALDFFGGVCRNIIAVPLTHKGKIMGVYNLFMVEDTAIPDDVALLFESISEHLGMALENARLTRENMRITLMNERQMLANEIHDSLAQTLAYTKMRVTLLQEALTASDKTMSAKYLNDVDEAVDSAYSGLRELLGQFRYRMDPRGLLPALQDVIQSFRNRTDLTIDFSNQTHDLNLAPEQEVQVFHIVQEALANISKHAHARHAAVKIERDADQYVVTIEDDGIGLAGGENTPGGLHFGMNIMSERAERIGGEVTVDSRIGEGTKVRLTFPAISGRKDLKS
jgi:two-component system nitrate/nitrite sensor histidine kinase NarX